jgi:3-oxoadipate enol-lactonase
MTAEHITVDDGCRLAYRLEGPEDAPVLMLSNSLGTTADLWAPQMVEFTRYFRVLRYDSRGHGKSDVPSGAYSIDRLGRDAVELLDALGIGRAWFCGLSMGGMVGQWLGVRVPEWLQGLVLANTAAYMGPPSNWQTRIATIREKGMTALTDAVLERWFTPGFRQHLPKAVEPIRSMLLACSPAGYAGSCAAIRDMDQRPTARLISVPTLLITGLFDPATPPSDAAFLNEAIAGSRIVSLEAAHLSNVEQPVAFTAAVLDFVHGAAGRNLK